MASAKISDRHPAARSAWRRSRVWLPVASRGISAGTNWCTARPSPGPPGSPDRWLPVPAPTAPTRPLTAGGARAARPPPGSRAATAPGRRSRRSRAFRAGGPRCRAQRPARATGRPPAAPSSASQPDGDSEWTTRIPSGANRSPTVAAAGRARRASCRRPRRSARSRPGRPARPPAGARAPPPRAGRCRPAPARSTRPGRGIDAVGVDAACRRAPAPASRRPGRVQHPARRVTQRLGGLGHPPGLGPDRPGRFDHRAGGTLLGVQLTAQLGQPVVQQVQRPAHGGGELAHLVGDVADVPQVERCAGPS